MNTNIVSIIRFLSLSPPPPYSEYIVSCAEFVNVNILNRFGNIIYILIAHSYITKQFLSFI